jgi:hypothetical protein
MSLSSDKKDDKDKKGKINPEIESKFVKCSSHKKKLDEDDIN